jgi:hypothetical protein
LLVFIDESGDSGFKLSKGSSTIFVVAMVQFADADKASALQLRIAELAVRLRVKPEFKFNKCKDEFRDAFFATACSGDFKVRAVVVRKQTIYSPALREVKESFYKFFVRMMMQHDGETLKGAKVIVDGSGDRDFKRQLRAYIRRNIGPESVVRIDLKDSHRDPLLQLADMCAGAIARSYRTDRANSSRWRRMLESSGRIDDVWEFK